VAKPPGWKPITDDEKQEIIRRYAEGETQGALIREYHCATTTLKRILQDGGVALRSQREITLAWLSKVRESGTVNTPIERRMQDALMVARIGFRTQRLLLGRYLVDILIDQAPIVIEADGMIHTHPRNKAKDALRDIALTGAGYRVFRFTGSEINTDATACVRRLIDACGLTPDEDPVYDIRTSFAGEDHPLWKGGKREYVCATCGEKFLAQPKHREAELAYCSRKCSAQVRRGQPRTAETIEKIRAGNTGQKRGPLSAETKAKMGAAVSAALKGKPKTAEHNANVSAAMKGKSKSPEHRAKISASLKRRNSQIKIESELRGDAQRAAEMIAPATLF
jgi:very-short-patch-repair endonuclease/DNA-directed RNA polymerase subunit RPC12/RpoP